jgi:hypothetical protein
VWLSMWVTCYLDEHMGGKPALVEAVFWCSLPDHHSQASPRRLTIQSILSFIIPLLSRLECLLCASFWGTERERERERESGPRPLPKGVLCLTVFPSSQCCLLALWHWAICLTSLNLSCLICKMGIVPRVLTRVILTKHGIRHRHVTKCHFYSQLLRFSSVELTICSKKCLLGWMGGAKLAQVQENPNWKMTILHDRNYFAHFKFPNM